MAFTSTAKLFKYLFLLSILLTALLAFVADRSQAAPNSEVQLTLKNELIVTGCASPDAFVSILVDDILVATTTADSGGSFSRSYLSPDPWIHNIKTFYEDSSGRVSATTSEDVSIAPQSTTTYEVLLSPTVANTADVEQGEDVVFQGSGCPFSLITLTLDGNLTLTTAVDTDGNWQISTSTDNFFIGLHVFEVEASLGGLTSEKSEKYSFQVLTPQQPTEPDPDPPVTTTPIQVTTPQVEELEPPTITSPADGYVTTKDEVLITGESIPNAQLEIFIDGIFSGSVFSNADGEWNFNLSMTDQQHRIKARVCIDFRCSGFSEEISIFYAGDASRCSLDFRLREYRFPNLTPGGGLDLELEILSELSTEYEIVLDWGDSVVEHFTHRERPTRTMHHVYNSIGQFNGSIEITDQNDCQHTQYFSVFVKPGESFFAQYWWLFVLIPVVMMTLWYIWRTRNFDDNRGLN